MKTLTSKHAAALALAAQKLGEPSVEIELEGGTVIAVLAAPDVSRDIAIFRDRLDAEVVTALTVGRINPNSFFKPCRN